MRHTLLAFTSSLGGGGAEKHLVRVLNHLDRTRFRVVVAVARGGGSYEAELADAQLHVLSSSMRGAVCKLAGLIDRTAPALVFSVMEHANCVALAASALARWRAPTVVGVQIPPLIEWRNNPRPGQLPLRLLVPLLYPRASRIVALSRGVREELAGWMPALGDRIAVIHNAGLDESNLRAAQEPVSPPPASGPVIVACGRLVEQKGFVHLIEALALVRREVPAVLWISGEGPLRARLEEQAQRAGVADAVWFAGFQANPHAYLKRARAFVLSSLWEGFANVVVEAMAVGTPVIATDCPYGPAEIIRHAGEGILVPPADAPALARAITQLLRSQELQRSLSHSGRERALDFSAARIARDYGNLFLDVIGAKLANDPLPDVTLATPGQPPRHRSPPSPPSPPSLPL